MKERSVGLDVDGTLIDTWSRQIELLDQCARLNGLGPLDLAAVREAKRNGASNRKVLLGMLGPRPEIESVCASWLARIESDKWLERDSLLPGVAEALRTLRSEGVKISFVSARQRPHGLQIQLAKFGLIAPPDQVRIVSPFSAGRQKAQALVELRVQAYVGDTTSDANACSQANIPFFAVTTGQHSDRLLRAVKSNGVHDSFHESVLAVITFLEDPPD